MNCAVLAAAIMLLAAAVTAQQDPEHETGARVQARVERGEPIRQQKYQRGDDGRLTFDWFAHIGGSGPAERAPVMMGGCRHGVSMARTVGLFCLLCPGSADLLAMTDTEWHLRALGMPTEAVPIRQHLATLTPADETDQQRVHLFEQMLLIDQLRRLGVGPKCPELRVLADDVRAAPAMRERARAAHAGLPALPADRRALRAADVLVPERFDFAVAIDHAQLPDLTSLAAAGRRAAMHRFAREIRAAGGKANAAMCNGAQYLCDVVGELPFAMTMEFGLFRSDRSCSFVQFDGEPGGPRITITAAGFFAGNRSGQLIEQLRTRLGCLEEGSATGDRLQIGKGRPRPDIADALLSKTAAVHLLVPADSRLWHALQPFGLPAHLGAEIAVSFGSPATVELIVQTADDAGAKEWARALDQSRAALRAAFTEPIPLPFRELEPCQELFDALFGAKLAAQGARCTALITIAGFDRAKFETLIHALAMMGP